MLSYDITSSETNHTFQAQRYIESTGQWVDASPPAGSVPILNDVNLGSELGPALLLPDGRVFQIGGNSHTAFYTLSSNTWSEGPELPTRADGTQLTADDAPAADLPNGKVLLALSPPVKNDTFPPGTQIFEYDPTANSITAVSLPGALTTALSQVPAYQTRMLDLPNGHVLFSIANSPGVWDYAPDGSPQSGWKPTIASPIAPPSNGVYTLLGTQFTGLSEGAAYGDDAEMSSNYPIVKLSEGGMSWYATTSNWVPGVATGSAVVGTDFTIPNAPAPGVYSVQVIANGIASTPTTLTTPGYNSAFWVDSRWASLPNGTHVSVDPVGPSYTGTVGQDAFSSVSAAIAAATNGGGGVVVINGADSATGSTGDFSTEAVTLNSSVSLYLQDGSVQFGSLAGAGGAVALSSGVNLTIGGDGTNTEFDGSITGVGSLTKLGAGTFTIDGSIGPLGGIAINAGKMKLGTSQAAAGLSGVTVTLNSLLGLNLSDFPTLTLGGLQGDANLDIGNTALTVGGDNAATVYSGNLTSGNTGSFTKTGAGSLTLAGPDSVNSTTVSNGTLFVNAVIQSAGGLTSNGDGVIVPASGSLLASDNVDLRNPVGIVGLDVSGLSTATLGGLNGSGGSISLGACALSTGQNNDTQDVFTGGVGGSGSLIKIGTGTLYVFTPAGEGPAFDVPVAVAAGAVAASDGSLTNSTVTVESGAVLVRSGTTPIVLGGLAGAGTVNMDTGALTVGGDNDSTTFSGTITAGSFTKTGAGVLTFPTPSSLPGYNVAGKVFVNAGILAVNAGGSGWASADIDTLLADASFSGTGGIGFNVPTGASFTYGSNLSGVYGLAKLGSGTLTLTGTDNVPGTATVSGGTLVVNGLLTGAGGQVDVLSGTVLAGSGTVNSAVYIAGTIEGGSAATPATLTVGNLTMSYGGTYGTLMAFLNSPTSYSQIFVTSNANLAGGHLALTLGSGFDNYASSQYVLISGYDFNFFSFTGAFNGQPDGSSITVGDQQFYIDYDPNHSVIISQFAMGGD